jgi:hypothetical protein
MSGRGHARGRSIATTIPTQPCGISWRSIFGGARRDKSMRLRPANPGHNTRRIQDWLGRRSIQHTKRYTQLSAAPFKDFWR